MDYNLLKKSLRMVAAFAEDSHIIQNVAEFEKIHSRNLYMLKEHVTTHRDSFMEQLISAIPQFDSKEIQGFMDNHRGSKSFLDYIGIVFGPIFLMLGFAFKRLDKNSGRLKKDTIDNIKTLSNKNLTIISVLENSGF
ncbi:hypothetical protein [Nonlabens sp.]|uniref:hypothetical protein n=1 Tax=Nonlabens sp. TaxID=1888209 RepID=UPI003F6A4B72